MTKETLLGAAALALTLAAPAAAVPIHLDFSFNGVTGTFYGLDNEVVGQQAATSFDFYGALNNYIAISPSSTSNFLRANEFEFVSGFLGPIEFDLTHFLGPGTRNGLLRFDLTLMNASVFEEVSRTGDFRITAGTPEFAVRTVSPVPLPAGVWLLLSGLMGVVGLKRRKKHIA